MDPARWQRIKGILDELLELDPADRRQRLEERCGDDAELLADVEKYLVAGEREGLLDATRTSAEGPGGPVLGLPNIPGYKVLRRLGEGGQGAVFEAVEEQLDRQVALKVLSMGGDARARERFLREAKIAGTLNHPNIVPVFDFGQAGDTLYFTMPLMHGLSVEELIPHLHDRAEEPAPDWLELPSDRTERIRQVLIWFEGAMDGLRHAHKEGVVHRDVKPSNLLLDPESGMLKVTDFGIARAGHLPKMTQEGTRMGTVVFMSPEQVRGENEKVDARTDVYSMGVSLYQTLLDQQPFTAENADEYFSRILHTAPKEPPQGRKLPLDLMVILLASMEKARRDRYPDIASMRDDLAAFCRGEPISRRPVGVGGRLWRWSRRRPTVAALLILLVLSLGVGSAVGIRFLQAQGTLRAQETESQFRDAIYDMAEGEFEKAHAGLSRVLRRDRNHINARLERALVVIEMLPAGAEKVEEALDDLAFVKERRPEIRPIGEMRRRLLNELGRSEETAEVAPDSLETTPELPVEFEILGTLAWIDDDQAKAIDFYNKALQLDARLPLVLIRRGSRFTNQGNFRDAFLDLKFLTGIWPDHHRPHNNLGNLLVKMGKYEDAFASFDQAIQRMSEPNSLVHFNYGLGLYAAKQYDKAEDQLRIAMDLNNDDTRPRNLLGRLFKKTERVEEAILEFNEVLRFEEARQGGALVERIGIAHTNLCDIYLERRDVERGKPSCLKDLELRPNNPIAHYNMAMLKMLSGDRDGAFASLEKNVDLGDDDYGWLLDDDVFDPLHDDPRFQGLIERMKAVAAQDSNPS